MDSKAVRQMNQSSQRRVLRELRREQLLLRERNALIGPYSERLRETIELLEAVLSLSEENKDGGPVQHGGAMHSLTLNHTRPCHIAYALLSGLVSFLESFWWRLREREFGESSGAQNRERTFDRPA